MGAFHLSQIQMGPVFSAFALGYALFQVPGGILADYFGPRRTLGWAMLFWALFTFLTGAIGKLVVRAGVSALTGLIALRFLLGISQEPMYPASTRSITNWFPPHQRARANALCITGISVGSVFMPPSVSRLVLDYGWEDSFFITAACAVCVALV